MSDPQPSLSQPVLSRGPSTAAIPPKTKPVPEPNPALCVPQLVSRQAAITPHNVAVTAGSKALTYAELDARANQLAHYLKSLGAGPERLVGLYLRQSTDFVIAALAALKCGAAYLPLDPDGPAERTAFMLRDAGVSALVTSEVLSPDVSSGTERIVHLGRDAAQIIGQSAQPPKMETQPLDLAYVIYTSGSTGQPKGVEVTHSSLANLVAWHNRAFGVTSADRASLLAAPGFDAVVWELWPYLTLGASVHVPDAGVRNNAKALRDWLVNRNITISFAATALAENLLTLDWPADTALRILLTGADSLRRRPPLTLPFTLVNNYGPTEYTVVATSGIVAPGDAASLPSIGRPIDNTTVYIMDEAMRVLPNGQSGEAYLGGAGVARGYRNRPELTAQRFVTAPFGSPTGGRLYRTGDLARVLPGGEIEFLGRVDEQIKIRGFRVEPNEIISVLNSCPGIHASAVIARDEQDGERRLVAYVVPTPGSPISLTRLREELANRLPDYMIPSVFVEMAAIPTTVNGKLDRAALPEPASADTLRDENYVAPTSLVEQRLAVLIAPLLRVERVGVDDNFFMLGGHSLLGTQLITRISQVFGVDLPLLSLFEHPTLAGMSAEIEKLIIDKVESSHWEASHPVTHPSTGGTQG
jgi:amino acid adenylation domain-containing protein